MKRAFVILLCFICIPVFLSGCGRNGLSDADLIEDLQNQVEELQAQLDAQKEDMQALETPAASGPPEAPEESGLPSLQPQPSVSPSLPPSPPPPVPPTAPPVSNPAMYDCDALLVSFDLNTGLAVFDYIVILQGDDAVQYMVSHQGKTLQQAQDIVDDWADSECIVKNDNPILRSVYMNGPDITMLWYPDGSEDYSLSGVSFTYAQFANLYINHPDKVDWYLFYHIDVNSAGDVVEVEQVYWP